MHAWQLWEGARTALGRLGNRLDRFARPLLAFFLLLILVYCLGSSARTYLWFDEIVILRTAALPSFGAIAHFYAAGRDTIGPFSALLVHAALKLPFGPETDGRLPSMVSFLVLLACTFAFLHRRYPAAYAFAALIPLCTRPMCELAWTAKGYMPEMGALGFAMLCWQWATEHRRRPWSVLGLWLGLAIAVSAHIFAIFVFVAFAAAQWLQDHRRRRVDLPIWIALCTFPAILLLTLRGTLAASRLYGHSFWSKPKVNLLYATYGDFLAANPHEVLCVFLCLLALAWLLRRGEVPAPVDTDHAGFTAPEWVFVVLLAALPCYAFAASFLLGAFRSLYVLGFVVGFSMLVMALVATLARRSVEVGALLAGLLTVSFLVMARSGLGVGASMLVRPYNVHTWLQTSYLRLPWVQLLESSRLPVLPGDHIVYAQLDTYAQPALRRRLVYLTDYSEISAYRPSATAQLNFLTFGRELQFQTMNLQDFVPEHPHFLLLLGDDPAMWLPQYLLRAHDAGRADLAIVGPTLVATPNVWDVHLRLPTAGAVPQRANGASAPAPDPTPTAGTTQERP